MGVSLHVTLLRDGNSAEHIAMVNAKRALDAAKLRYPKELLDYFQGSNNEDEPLEIAYKPVEWSNDYASGYELDLDSLPSGVKKIRVYLS